MSRSRTARMSCSSAGAGRELRLSLGVDLGERDVVVLGAGGLEDRSEHPARSAPTRPPVDERDPLAGDDVIERLRCEVDRCHGVLLGSDTPTGITIPAGPLFPAVR